MKEMGTTQYDEAIEVALNQEVGESTQLRFFEEDLDVLNSKKSGAEIDYENIAFEKVGRYCQITLGDCVQVMAKLPSDSVDLMITDPPYNLGEFMHGRNTNLVKMRDNHFAYSGWDDLPYDEWHTHMNDFFRESNRILKKKGSMLMFMSLIKVESLIELAQKHNFYYKTVGVWHKTNPMPRNMNLHFINSTECWLYFVNEGATGTFNNNGKIIHDYIETSVTPASEKRHGKHPTQKPLKLINHFIKTLSNEGDTVIDPFMGSGSTAVGCELLGRNFIGIDLEEKYYSLAKKRVNNSHLL
jgi:DNA modification methylase